MCGWLILGTITLCSSWCSYPLHTRGFRGSATFPCGISRAFSMRFSSTPVWWSFSTTGCTELSTRSPASGAIIISTTSPLFLSQQLVIVNAHWFMSWRLQYCWSRKNSENIFILFTFFSSCFYVLIRWGDNDAGADAAIFAAAGAPAGRCNAGERLHEHGVHIRPRLWLLQVLGPLQLRVCAWLVQESPRGQVSALHSIVSTTTSLSCPAYLKMIISTDWIDNQCHSIISTHINSTILLFPPSPIYYNKVTHLNLQLVHKFLHSESIE